MKKETKIIPAIIAKNQEELTEKLNRLSGHAHTIQLDVMDNKFVNNRSLDFDFTLPENGFIFEAHLMVEDPETWIAGNIDKVQTIIAPIESSWKPEELIQLVKSAGKRVGFALNPETSTEKVKPFLKEIDQVLILTVNPGFYGSRFIPEALEKVKEIRQLAPELDIEVDGGMSPNTIGKAAAAGANLFVSGSYTVDADDVDVAIESLKKEVEDYERD